MVNGFQILVAIFGDRDNLGLLIDEYLLNFLCINYHLIPNFVAILTLATYTQLLCII